MSMKKKWSKSSPGLVDLFERMTAGYTMLEERTMFGYPVRFVNGNMMTGLHEENMIIRLSEEDRERFAKEFDASPFEPFPGRAMREYMAIPDELLGDENTLHAWLDASLEYTSSLPVKKSKTKSKKR